MALLELADTRAISEVKVQVVGKCLNGVEHGRSKEKGEVCGGLPTTA